MVCRCLPCQCPFFVRGNPWKPGKAAGKEAQKQYLEKRGPLPTAAQQKAYWSVSRTRYTMSYSMVTHFICPWEVSSGSPFSTICMERIDEIRWAVACWLVVTGTRGWNHQPDFIRELWSYRTWFGSAQQLKLVACVDSRSYDKWRMWSACQRMAMKGNVLWIRQCVTILLGKDWYYDTIGP